MSWQDYEYGPADDDYVSMDKLSDLGWLSPDEYSKAAMDVLNERNRQQATEGWTPEHDDGHTDGSMALAASMYADPRWNRCPVPKGGSELYHPPHDWPWAAGFWKPKDRRRDLVRAGALIIAEIERLDRLAAAATPPGTKVAAPDGGVMIRGGVAAGDEGGA